MNADIYNSLSPKEKLFADLLSEIASSLKKLERDISQDLSETLR